MKTIRMPKELLDKWLKALRGGGYKQAKNMLYNEKTCGFCCLGVLQHVASKGYVECDDDTGEFERVPSLSWLRKNNISFKTSWGAEAGVPYLPTLMESAANANDSGRSFKTLADAIEACAEGV